MNDDGRSSWDLVPPSNGGAITVYPDSDRAGMAHVFRPRSFQAGDHRL
jgi:hypothetical protein